MELTTEEFIAQVREIGLAIVGQTADLVPADKKLYALRDVTATVDIVPLIASSIMSKKLAAGADAIVLDVKVGAGAFMKTRDDAVILAEQMIDLGRRAGREVVVLLTDMSQPLGRAVGNALEIREAVDTIRGARAGPISASSSSTRAHGCSRCRISRSTSARVALAPRRPSPTGRRLPTTSAGFSAQGGDPDVALLPSAPVVHEVRAPRDGIVSEPRRTRHRYRRARAGCGRRTKTDEIDHAVGVVCRPSAATRPRAGDVLAEVHAADEVSAATADRAVLAAYRLGDGPVRRHDIVLAVLE